jgi:hypothetical protein
MQKLFLSILLVTSSFMYAQEHNNHDGHSHNHDSHSDDNVKKEKSMMVFNTLLIERENILFGADEEFSFTFKNNGKEPIIVNNVQTSCGCTTAKKPEAPVAPNKKGEISVKYDTKRVGPFVKTITVSTNVDEPVILTIKGIVLPEKTSNNGEEKNK